MRWCERCRRAPARKMGLAGFEQVEGEGALEGGLEGGVCECIKVKGSGIGAE